MLTVRIPATRNEVQDYLGSSNICEAQSFASLFRSQVHWFKCNFFPMYSSCVTKVSLMNKNNCKDKAILWTKFKHSVLLNTNILALQSHTTKPKILKADYSQRIAEAEAFWFLSTQSRNSALFITLNTPASTNRWLAITEQACNLIVFALNSFINYTLNKEKLVEGKRPRGNQMETNVTHSRYMFLLYTTQIWKSVPPYFLFSTKKVSFLFRSCNERVQMELAHKNKVKPASLPISFRWA